MLRRWVHVLALTIFCSGESSPGLEQPSTVKRLQALREKVLRQQERLETLEHAKQRRLPFMTSPYSPSIYGEYSPHTRAYTAQENFEGALTHSWLVLCAMLAFFMQAGMTVFRAGLCRKEYVQHCTLLSLVDVCIGIIAWWLFGWAFALSGPYEIDKAQGTSLGKTVDWWGWQDGDNLRLESRFGGSRQFAGSGFLVAEGALGGQQEPSPNIAKWFYRGATVLMATSIATGGLAERVRLEGAAIASFLLTAVVFPIPVAWQWGRGWLHGDTSSSAGAFDFAGSGVIHLSGGVAALVGAVIVKSRDGRFPANDSPDAQPKANERDFTPNSHMLVTLGTFILWFGWYGFNCGSNLAMTTGLQNGIEYGFQAAVVAMNTSISAASAGLLVFSARRIIDKEFRVAPLCNGTIAGLVSICAACSTVETGFACLIGAIGGLVYLASSFLMTKMKIDDPFDAFPIHGACGAWGVMAAALFDWGKGFDNVHGPNGFRCLAQSSPPVCLSGVGGNFVLQNFWLVITVTLWVGLLSAIIFGVLKRAGRLRIPDWPASDSSLWPTETPEHNRHDTGFGNDPGLDARIHRPTRAYAMESHSSEIATKI
mmetsp:Transcript_103654/g.200861  ORF Transcript_103654/g.200861 Transcript_103654/m.200861 type:complete len:596 (-) Transcript_103654:287-2074(-)